MVLTDSQTRSVRQPVDVISVHPNSTTETLRRRLAQSRARRIVLMLPEDWRELDSLARLRLLQRQAQIQRRELALITRTSSTRKAAQQLGIPAFQDVNEMSKHGAWRMDPALPPVDPRHPAKDLPDPPPWRTGEWTGDGGGHQTPSVIRQAARPSLHKARQKRIQAEMKVRSPLPQWMQFAGYGLVGLFLLALLGGFVLVVLPAATVTVVPGQSEATATVELTADPSVTVPDLETGLIPARAVETFVEVTGSIATTGREQRASDPAVGTVVFTNLGNQPVKIPANTIVSTSTGERIEFRTTEPADLPGPAGNRVSVPIEAVEPGIQGNVRANTITTVGGALRFQVRVTNPNATSGGTSSLVPVVKQVDKDNLLDAVYAQAQAQAHDKLLPELTEGEWLPDASVQTYIIAQFFDHFNDEPAEELSLTLRVLIQGIAIDQESAQEAAFHALEDAVPQRAKLVADSIVYLVDPDMTVAGSTVQLKVTAKGNYVIPIDAREMRSAIAGLTPEEATSLLQREWILADVPQYYLDPPWKKTLPSIPTRIQIRVEYSPEVTGS